MEACGRGKGRLLKRVRRLDRQLLSLYLTIISIADAATD